MTQQYTKQATESIKIDQRLSKALGLYAFLHGTTKKDVIETLIQRYITPEVPKSIEITKSYDVQVKK